MEKKSLLHVLIIAAVLLGSFGLQAVLAGSPAAQAAGAILYVEMDASGDCGTWALACDLQTALNKAARGDEIWVQAGIYTPTTDPGSPSATFQLKSGVALYGGFAGSETSRAQRDWSSNVTVLSGDLAGDDRADPHGVVTDTVKILGSNSYNVVTGSGVDASAILDGFTITAGYSPMYGGGMTNWNGGSPTLSNLVISGNRARDVGGGMFNFKGSNPALTNVTFSGNKSDAGGGGLYNHESSPTLTDVTFTGNSAANGAAMVNYINSNPILINVIFSGNRAGNKAGGMDNNSNSNPTLTNVTFTANTARYGSGMYNYRSSPTLTDVTFSGNTAGHVGGGMENEESSPTLTNVTFSGNKADHEGGGMFNTNGSNPTLMNVLFSENSVTGEGGGGGMMNYFSSNPSLTNVTFSGNSASWGGGGMANWASRPTLTNVTFTGNSADYGAAIANGESSPTLTNVVIWSNRPLANQVTNDNKSSPVVTYSLIQGGYRGVGNFTKDPRLEALADNGGFTLTHALSADSPAIDAGDPASCPQTDQRGLPRPVDGNEDGQAICDIGVFEYQTLAPPPAAPAVAGEGQVGQAFGWGDLVRVEIINKSAQDVSITLYGDKSVYALNVDAGASQLFTVERGSYSRITQACGVSDAGSVDIAVQLRLVFTPCWGPAPNKGEPSLEKIHIPDSPGGKHWYYK